MRRTTTAAVALGMVLLFGMSAVDAAMALPVESNPDLTAGQLIVRLREANRRIVANAGPELRDRASAAVADLVDLANRLESVFGETMDLPLADLREDHEEPVAQGLAALILAEDFAAAMSTCIGVELPTSLDAFGTNVHRTIGDSRSWSGASPRVLRVTSVDGGFPHVLSTGSPALLSVNGDNLHSDDCGPVSARIVDAGGAGIEVRAAALADSTVALEIPSLDESGVYEISIRLRRRKLLFFCRSATASVSVAVLPAAPFRVRYSVATTRAIVQEIVWNAGELKLSNPSCDTDTTAARLFRLPEGWTYASHEWVVFLNSGAVKRKEEVRGDDVYVEYRVPGRGGSFCTGEEKLIYGKMEIRGERTILEPGPSVEGELTRPMTFGETVSIPVEFGPTEDSSIAEWSIEVQLIYPDGRVLRLPAGRGTGPLEGAERGGGAYSWDPGSGKLVVSAPAGCGAGTE